jgi:hypothetical protein
LNKDRYYTAQLWLGRIYLELNKSTSEKYWNSIPETEKSTYFHAQFEIAKWYFLDNIQIKAIEHFLNALKYVSDERKAQVLLWLSVSYRLNGQYTEARETLSKVSSKKSSDHAEILMQEYLLDSENIQNVSKLIKIKEVDGWPYYWAQAVLANESWKRGEKEKAISYWLNIQNDHSDEYRHAQSYLYKLGIKYYLDNNC